MQRRDGVFPWVTLCLLVLGCAGIARAQVNTATLSGTVTDPQGLAVRGAKLTITSAATGAERTVESDEVGRYKVVGLPPGRYKVSVDGGASFATYENDSVVLTVGEDATLDTRLVLKGVQQTVMVRRRRPRSKPPRRKSRKPSASSASTTCQSMAGITSTLR